MKNQNVPKMFLWFSHIFPSNPMKSPFSHDFPCVFPSNPYVFGQRLGHRLTKTLREGKGLTAAKVTVNSPCLGGFNSLIGGDERNMTGLFSHILGIIIPISYFSEGFKPPTSSGLTSFTPRFFRKKNIRTCVDVTKGSISGASTV